MRPSSQVKLTWQRLLMNVIEGKKTEINQLIELMKAELNKVKADLKDELDKVNADAEKLRALNVLRSLPS